MNPPPTDPTDPTASATPAAPGSMARQEDEASSLRGELRSILALYLIGAILPLLVGFVFGPESS